MLTRRRFLALLPVALPVALAQGYGNEPTPTPPKKLTPDEVDTEIASLKRMDDALLYVIIRHGQSIREVSDYLHHCLKCGEVMPTVRGDV